MEINDIITVIKEALQLYIWRKPYGTANIDHQEQEKTNIAAKIVKFIEENVK